MNTILHRVADRVWLEHVDSWSLHERPSSVHAAQAAIMSAVGADVTYDYLVGVSSLAFRMQISRLGFCPSSPHSFCGCQCVDRSREALPWHARVFEMPAEETAKVSQARQAVVDSVERGVPVQYGNEEDGLIIGYQRKVEEWICLHPLRERGSKPFITTEWPWGVAVFTHPKAELPARRELALGALQQAVKMGKGGNVGVGDYYVGLQARGEYIGRLKVMESAPEQAKNNVQLRNAWIYECLGSYRASAARYLREIATEFLSPAAEHLQSAASHYGRMFQGHPELRGRRNCPCRSLPSWICRGGISGPPRCSANRCGDSRQPYRWSGKPFTKLRRQYLSRA